MSVSVPCSSCSSAVGFGDDFCPKCGGEVSNDLKRALRERLEASDDGARMKSEQVRKASQMLLVIAGLFLLGGLVMFAMAQGTTEQALAHLKTFPAGSQVTVEGKVYVVERLRELVEREPYEVLGLNVGLAVIMAALYAWSRRAPFPALVSALAAFVTVHAVSAVVDPKTLFMGIIVKVIAIVALVRGVRAAIEFRQIERGRA